MVIRQRRLAGLGLGHGDPAPAGEVRQPGAGFGIVDAAAGDDQRLFRRPQQRGGSCSSPASGAGRRGCQSRGSKKLSG
jgi:hypothetical protein